MEMELLELEDEVENKAGSEGGAEGNGDDAGKKGGDDAGKKGGDDAGKKGGDDAGAKTDEEGGNGLVIGLSVTGVVALLAVAGGCYMKKRNAAEEGGQRESLFVQHA